MTADRTTLENAFNEARKEIFRATQGWAMRYWLELDLTVAQLKTLMVLEDEGPSTIGHVAEVLGITLPTASHLVDKLVHSGHVERAEDPLDRRRAVARPSARGDELLHRLQEGDPYTRLCLDRISDEDLAAFVQGLRAFARATREIGTDPELARDESEDLMLAGGKTR
jgi:MarR family transcriptional regulator, organic hydroperoxide resistance regulator